MAAYWEIAAHSAYDMFSKYKFPPRFFAVETFLIIAFLYHIIIRGISKRMALFPDSKLQDSQDSEPYLTDGFSHHYPLSDPLSFLWASGVIFKFYSIFR